MVGCGLAPLRAFRGGQPCPATGPRICCRVRARSVSRCRPACCCLSRRARAFRPATISASVPQLLSPLPPQGDAGATAPSMRNAAEMALAEFNNPDIQLLVKDDGGTPGGAQQAVQQALSEGAEIILGPLFAQSV